MKYNKAYTGGVFETYLEYLISIKDKLSNEVFEFVSDSKRHDFSEESLHDSWLKSLECVSDFDDDTTQITITLLGDREFHLHFKNVSQYKISQQMSDRCRDLITYEIGIEEDCFGEEQQVFRAEFSGEDAGIEIYAEHIEIKENKLPSTND